MPPGTKRSAGLLMYRISRARLEVLLVHPGGPFFATKDAGIWSIPKGEIGDTEDALEAATREFREETGVEPRGPFLPLGTVRQRGGKTVAAWAFEGDCDPRAMRSNTFTLEWPPQSGKRREFPEVDRAAFLAVPDAIAKINQAQVSLLWELEDLVRKSHPELVGAAPRTPPPGDGEPSLFD